MTALLATVALIWPRGLAPSVAARSSTDASLLPVRFSGKRSWNIERDDLQTNRKRVVDQIGGTIVIQADSHIFGFAAASGRVTWTVDLNVISPAKEKVVWPNIQCRGGQVFALGSGLLDIDPITGHLNWSASVSSPAGVVWVRASGDFAVVSALNDLYAPEGLHVLNLRTGDPASPQAAKLVTQGVWTFGEGTMAEGAGGEEASALSLIGRTYMNGVRLNMGDAIGERIWNGKIIARFSNESGATATMDGLGDRVGLTGIALYRTPPRGNPLGKDLWGGRFLVHEPRTEPHVPEYAMPFAVDSDGTLLTTSRNSILRIQANGTVTRVVSGLADSGFAPCLTNEGLLYQAGSRIMLLSRHRATARFVLALGKRDDVFVLPAGLLVLSNRKTGRTIVRLISQKS